MLQDAVLQLLLGVARGMAYLHNHNVCHGDLKAANVLLTAVPEGSTPAPLPISATNASNIETQASASAINVSMACCYVSSSGGNALERGTWFVPKVADFGLSRWV
jgi:serine/threonine protein kinase